MRSAVRICIEGNIGCGKSSVLETLQEVQASNPDWEKYTLVPEPVHEWHHLLGPLYAAPPHSAVRHSIAALLQVAVLNAYALRVPSPVFAPTVITERSSWSSLAVFLPGQGLGKGTFSSTSTKHRRRAAGKTTDMAMDEESEIDRRPTTSVQGTGPGPPTCPTAHGPSSHYSSTLLWMRPVASPTCYGPPNHGVLHSRPSCGLGTRPCLLGADHVPLRGPCIHLVITAGGRPLAEDY